MAGGSMSGDRLEPLFADFAELHQRSAEAVQMGNADPEALMRGLESVTVVRWRWIISREGGAKLIPVSPWRLTVAGLFRAMERIAAEYSDAFLSSETQIYDLRAEEGRTAFRCAVSEIAAEMREVMQ